MASHLHDRRLGPRHRGFCLRRLSAPHGAPSASYRSGSRRLTIVLARPARPLAAMAGREAARASTMIRRLVFRVLSTLPVIWLVVSIVFLLIHLVPGDPIEQMLGEGAPAADIAATRHAYGLDAPLGEQYLRYWKGVLHGDLGRSFRYNQTVAKLIVQRYPYTLQLTLAALMVAIVLSIPAGVRSARRRNRWDDRLLSVVSLFGLSFPNFALGPILILLFAIKAGWLPVSGAGSFANLVLPAMTMGSALAAILTRMVRT